MYRLLLALWVTTSSISAGYAQSQRTDIRQNLVWYDASVGIPMTQATGLHVESGQRRSLEDGAVSQQFFRTGVNFRLFDFIKTTAGFAHFQNDADPEFRFIRKVEWRGFQFWTVEHSAGKWSADFRLRTEQRFFEQTDEKDQRTGFRFNHRVGYRIRGRYYVFGTPGKTGATYLEAGNEVMVNYGRNIDTNYFDQTRWQVGVSRKITRQVAVQVSGMFLYQQLSGGSRYNLQQVLRVQAVVSL